MKAAIYCRLSEEDRNKQQEADDSRSIQNQKAMLLQYCLEHNWEVYSLYSDDDYTGSDRNRPEFKRLLRDAEQKKFDIVLCKSQSRFTRELELVERYLHGLFPLWGIRFISVVDNADTANKGNKKSRQINGLVNEWYLEDMSENIKSVLTSRRQNGFHIGAFALYGYQKDPDRKGHLIIDEEAAAIVREVFTLYSQGYGKTAIARILNDRGVPNPTEYKRLHGLRYRQPKGKNSTLWSYSAISDMLVNEMYIGNMVQGKYGSVSYKTKENKPQPKSEWYRVEGTHEPIIDRTLWERTQAQIAQKARPFSTGRVGLFARKVRCAHCGCVMRSGKSRGRRYLQCASRRLAKDACIGAFISVEKLEQAVLAELNRLTDMYLDRDVLERSIAFRGNFTIQKARLEHELTSYRKKIEEYEKGLRELYLDKVREVVNEEEFSVLSKEFSSEKKRLQDTIRDCEVRLKDLEKRIMAGDDCRKIVDQYVKPDHLTHDMVECLIDNITVKKRDSITKAVSIEIHWKF